MRTREHISCPLAALPGSCRHDVADDVAPLGDCQVIIAADRTSPQTASGPHVDCEFSGEVNHAMNRLFRHAILSSLFSSGATHEVSSERELRERKED
jgi:hypothetical protein